MPEPQPIFADLPSLPPLTPRQSDILAAFIASGGAIAALLDTHKIPAQELLNWSASPAVQSHLAALTQLSEIALTYRASQSRVSALNKLDSTLAASTDPVESRRLSNSIAHLCHGSRPQGEIRASSSRRTDPRSHAPSLPAASPHLTYSPSPSLSHPDLARLFSCSIQTPQSAAALLAIRAYLAPGAMMNQTRIPVDTPSYLHLSRIGYEHFGRPSGAYAAFISETDSTARYRICLIAQGGRAFPIELTLSRSHDGPHPSCWLIASIAYDTS
jgi:hypothetical protein